MKVESLNDVQLIQRVEQPRVSAGQAAAAATGLDDIAQIFNQEVALNSQALNRRAMGVAVPAVEQLARIYDQLGHPAQETMASMARRVRSQLMHKVSADKLLALTGGDPARAFVVLKHVAAQAQAEVRVSEEALAQEAIDRLRVRFKGEIQAGLNIAFALEQAAGNPQERQAVRSLYYASVVTRQSLATMMQSLLGLFGGDRFADGLNVMRRALADDIAAHSPSVPTAQLRTLLLGLQSCAQLGGALANCQALLQRLSTDEDSVSLLQRLLGYTATGVDSGEVLRLAEDLGGELAAGQLVSLNALYPVIQRLPQSLWRDSRGRQEALHKFLLVMDEFARVERGNAHIASELRGSA
ncbi:type III secretion system gatekeeper subunit SctW [Pseudomonas sp. PSPC3-3]|uniref:type III secretion system gatekeeper subunit SctW n=1 Tax=unclassified Pseudomonas TaxID=196821 RepID=UPI003CF5F9F9